MARRNALGRHAGDRTRHRLRGEAGAVDDDAGRKAHGAAVGRHVEVDPARRRRAAAHAACERDHRARVLGLAEKGEHQRVAVDDSGGRREQRGCGAHRGFQLPRLGAVDQYEIVDAVRRRLGLQRLQRRDAPGFRGDDHLAEAAVRHAAARAIVVERVAAGDAEPRLEAAGRVVDAGVDHLAVARARFRADGFGGLDNHHLAAGAGQSPRHGEADDTGADHHRIDRFAHARRLPRIVRRGP